MHLVRCSSCGNGADDNCGECGIPTCRNCLYGRFHECAFCYCLSLFGELEDLSWTDHGERMDEMCDTVRNLGYSHLIPEHLLFQREQRRVAENRRVDEGRNRQLEKLRRSEDQPATEDWRTEGF